MHTRPRRPSKLSRLRDEVRALRLQLQRSAAAETAAQNASPLGLFRTDADGRLTHVNHAWRRIHGLSEDAPIEDWDAGARGDETAHVYLASGEHALQRPDGQIVQLMVRRADIVIDGRMAGSSGTVEDVTEQRASEQAQHALTEILELSTDLIIQTNEHGHCLYLNPALRRWFGIPLDRPAESLRRGDVAPEETIARWHAEILPTALKQGHWHGKTRVTNANGEPRVLSHLLIAHHDPAGQHHLFSSIMRDVTEQMHTEQQLRDSERRLINITNGVPALIAEINDDYTYGFANRAYMDWLGVMPQEMLGHTVEEMLGSELFKTIGPHHAAAFRGERVTYERIARNTGTPRWIRVTLVPRLGEDGNANGCYAIAFDITEQRNTEAALRHSERLLVSIADRLPMRVSYVDQQERFLFANRAVEQDVGQPRSAIYGRTIREIQGETRYREVAPWVRQALDGSEVEFEWEFTDARGYRCYRAEYRPLYGEDGREVTGLVSIVSDMTGQKAEERRLRALSQRDPLTGLLNRAGFDGALHNALQRSAAGSGAAALMYLDIDRFKQVNDALGHDAGDLLLQAFGGRLERILRATDVIARLGGDEFVVLLEGCGTDEAGKVATSIVTQMQTPFVLEDRTVHVTTSIGVAMHNGSRALTPREFLRRADAMLYQAKNAGRNVYRIESSST